MVHQRQHSILGKRTGLKGPNYGFCSTAGTLPLSGLLHFLPNPEIPALQTVATTITFVVGSSNPQ